jgi:hypothetical protein
LTKSLKRTILAVVAGLALASPSVAHADFMKELKASDHVEQKASKRWRHFNISATCDQQGRSKFWCSFFGSHGDCLLSGKAWVRNPGYRVQIVSGEKDCF